ncbi:MAG: 16S rRNA (guanine(527)-N(7))-methyltransferase RsmG [Desulfuromonadales bacterium]|nr:16S rRNA (guanine(527)-N(7))-methyltransferase RsmG [Desulfuromonadales bacterium]
MLSELLHRLDLQVGSEAVALLEGLIDELLRWNPRRNLTAITGRDEVIEKHLVDSLTLLPFARQSSRLLDIGSGAGFPALPLKIVCPEIEVVSVDAVGKKIDFQRHVVRRLGLQGFKAIHARVETLTEDHASFDLVTARALCSLPKLIALAEPFLTPDGRLLAMKGPEGCREFSEQQEALREDGWSVALHRLKLPLSSAERCLIELSR